MTDDVSVRAERYAALGDPIRLAIVDELAVSDLAPVELQRRLDIPSNLLAHHLDVLEAAGWIVRGRSSGDGRRRYVQLRTDTYASLLSQHNVSRPVLFVCTHNSARSQLAAALWEQATRSRAESAGTHPSDRVHPGAIAAARRAGLDLSRSRPRHFDVNVASKRQVITVCDRAHEALNGHDDWLHWSVPDPVAVGTRTAFDDAVAELSRRIETLQRHGTER